MARFLADFNDGKRQGRYVTASLPELPFADRRFGLALVSHLLFLYSQQLDLEFHWASVQELMRVADEVRIFPLLTVNGQKSPFIEPICGRLKRAGVRFEIERVAYEFQRGGNQMLRISL